MGMRKYTQIKPGLLTLFRLTNGLWLLLYGSELIGWMLDWNPFPTPWWLVNTLTAVVMLVYLYSGRLERRLGRRYLPVGLLIASVGTIMAQWAEIGWRINQDMPAGLLYDSDLDLFVGLFIPMIIITAQYGFRMLLGFLVGTAAVQIIVMVPFHTSGAVVSQSFLTDVYAIDFLTPEPLVDLIIAEVIGRTIIFPIIGFFVVRLVVVQYYERRALTEKNIELTRYATTVERLAVSHERNRLARELHDTLAHTLSAVSVQLEALDKQLDGDPDSVKATVDRLRDLTRSGLKESRRALSALRASPLEDLGFALAMEQLVHAITERSGLATTLDMPDALDELSPAVEQSVYRITEEALNNVTRHAQAEQVAVVLTHKRDGLALLVTDDGIGFDPETACEDGHYGITGMRERAGLCNGQLRIESQPGMGTTVRLNIEGKL